MVPEATDQVSWETLGSLCWSTVRLSSRRSARASVRNFSTRTKLQRLPLQLQPPGFYGFLLYLRLQSRVAVKLLADSLYNFYPSTIQNPKFHNYNLNP